MSSPPSLKPINIFTHANTSVPPYASEYVSEETLTENIFHNVYTQRNKFLVKVSFSMKYLISTISITININCNITNIISTECHFDCWDQPI